MANGIPALLNNIANVTNTVSLLISDFQLLTQPEASWGIYFAGTNQKALIPDNVIDLSYKKEYKISDYPVELGSFANFNKVEMPFVSQVRMSVGGTQNDRAHFLYTLESLSHSTELFDIITPEHIYLNANIIDYDFSRSATNGSGLIVADIRLMEVRTTAKASFSKTVNQSDQDSVNSGQLSPGAPLQTIPPALDTMP